MMAGAYTVRVNFWLFRNSTYSRRYKSGKDCSSASVWSEREMCTKS